MGKVIKEIKERRSVRKYINKPIEDYKIIEMLESARLAPSGVNSQPWKFIIIKSEEMRKKVMIASHNQIWMMEAPVFIACIGDISERINDKNIVLDENTSEEDLKRIIRDTSIATEHLVLEAEHLGLNTCWIAWFTQEEIRKALSIPKDKYVVAVITVGYGAENPSQRPRKDIEDIVMYEKWQD